MDGVGENVGTVCQVKECQVPLDDMKEYHQRYRICPDHLKADSVVIDRNKYRFCQQCGRFEMLSEFDDDKRSCRRRLQKHNARRRKKKRCSGSATGGEDDGDGEHIGKQIGDERMEQDAHRFQKKCKDEMMNMKHMVEGERGTDGSDAGGGGARESASKVAGIVANALHVDAVSIPPLVPDEGLMAYYLASFARLFQYKIESMRIEPLQCGGPSMDDEDVDVNVEDDDEAGGDGGGPVDQPPEEVRHPEHGTYPSPGMDFSTMMREGAFPDPPMMQTQNGNYAQHGYSRQNQ